MTQGARVEICEHCNVKSQCIHCQNLDYFLKFFDKE